VTPALYVGAAIVAIGAAAALFIPRKYKPQPETAALAPKLDSLAHAPALEAAA
jgi:hypothetical protein